MAIDLEITARLAEIAETLELLAGIEADSALKRDVEITARLKRINDSLQGGALSAHLIDSHPDATVPGPNDGDFFRYASATTDWVAATMELSDATDVSATPTAGTYLRGNGTIWTESSILLADLPPIALPNLSDVDSTMSPSTTSDVMVWGGAEWDSRQLALVDISDWPASFGSLSNINAAADSATTTLRMMLDTGLGIWAPALAILNSLGDVSVPAPNDDDLFIYDSGIPGWTNQTIAATLDGTYVRRDGTLALTGNWDAGNYDITAAKLIVNETATGAAETNIQSTRTVTEVSGFDTNVYKGIDIDINWTFNNAIGISLGGVYGIYSDVTMVNTAGTLFSTNMKPFYSAATATGFAFSTSPFQFVASSNNVGSTFGAGSGGALLVQVTSPSANLVGIRSECNASSAVAPNTASTVGYQGYSTGAAYTGNQIGVQGWTNAVTASNGTWGILGTPALGGTIDRDRRTAIGGYNGHLFINDGSGIFTDSSIVGTFGRPKDVSTTHLDFLNNTGELYAEGNVEIDGTLYADGAVDIVGDAKFTTANGGWPFGEIYLESGSSTVTVSSAGWTQMTLFAVNGQSNQCTPDHTNDHITIDVAGMYLVTVSMASKNAAGATHEVQAQVYKNNGATAFANLHAHRSLAATADSGSLSLSGIITVSANDTIELWMTSDSGTNKTVTIIDCTMSVVQIGA